MHANSDADVNHDFLGKVIEAEGDSGLVEVRNVFASGDRAEILSCHSGILPFEIGELITADGIIKKEARHPMEQLRMALPAGAQKGDILRRSRQ